MVSQSIMKQEMPHPFSVDVIENTLDQSVILTFYTLCHQFPFILLYLQLYFFKITISIQILISFCLKYQHPPLLSILSSSPPIYNRMIFFFPIEFCVCLLVLRHQFHAIKSRIILSVIVYSCLGQAFKSFYPLFPT